MGFSVSFLLTEFGLKGLIFSLLAILPQNIFIIPGLIILAVLSITYSVNFLKRKKTYYFKTTKIQNILNYSIGVAMISIFFIVGSFVEAYLTPLLMKIVLKS